MLRTGGFTSAASDAFGCSGIILQDVSKLPVMLWIRIIQGHIIPCGEDARYIDAIRAWHTITTARTADFCAADIRAADILHQFQFIGTHDTGFHCIENPQIFINLFLFAA